MILFETKHFKVFTLKINGVKFFFISKNVENSGFLFVYKNRVEAIKQCCNLEYGYQEGTLIL